jgi:hypothetical protein
MFGQSIEYRYVSTQLKVKLNNGIWYNTNKSIIVLERELRNCKNRKEVEKLFKNL